MSTPRSITFYIPGLPDTSMITVTENRGNLDFTAKIIGSPFFGPPRAFGADVRALFLHFDESHLQGLKVTGGGGRISNSQVKAN